MIKRLLARLAAAAADDRWATVYCEKCGGFYPPPHSH